MQVENAHNGRIIIRVTLHSHQSPVAQRLELGLEGLKVKLLLVPVGVADRGGQRGIIFFFVIIAHCDLKSGSECAILTQPVQLVHVLGSRLELGVWIGVVGVVVWQGEAVIVKVHETRVVRAAVEVVIVWDRVWGGWTLSYDG